VIKIIFVKQFVPRLILFIVVKIVNVYINILNVNIRNPCYTLQNNNKMHEGLTYSEEIYNIVLFLFQFFDLY
jgi:hypothetical protein